MKKLYQSATDNVKDKMTLGIACAIGTVAAAVTFPIWVTVAGLSTTIVAVGMALTVGIGVAKTCYEKMC